MIDVLFQTESHFPVNREKVKRAVIDALSHKIKRDAAEVNITIVGDRKMHRLNLTYRKIDHTTDVLSFPLNDITAYAKVSFVDVPDGVLRLGDIVVSYPQAVAEAGEENTLVDDKIIELVLHGLDHLLGIHHPE